MTFLIPRATRLFVIFFLTICIGRGYDEKGFGIVILCGGIMSYKQWNNFA